MTVAAHQPEPTPSPERRLEWSRRIGARRFALIGFIAACGCVAAGGRGDWSYFAYLGRQLVGESGLHLYARFPDTQTGPFTLLVAGLLSHTPRNGFVACVILLAAAGLLVMRQIESQMDRSAPELERNLRVLIAGVLVAVWWSMFGRFGHIDDGLGLLLVVFALDAHIGRHPMRAGLLVGLAIGFKPWTVMFWPLALPARGETLFDWRTARSVGILAATVVGTWAPFVLADRDTLSGLSPTVLPAYDSVLRLLGLVDLADSTWLRLLQLVLSSCVVLAATRTNQVEAAVMGGIAVRIMLDPGTWPYYSTGLVVGAVIWDLRRTRRMLPLWGLGTSLALVPTSILPFERLRAVLRLMCCVAAVACALRGSFRNRGTPELVAVAADS